MCSVRKASLDLKLGSEVHFSHSQEASPTHSYRSVNPSLAYCSSNADVSACYLEVLLKCRRFHRSGWGLSVGISNCLPKGRLLVLGPHSEQLGVRGQRGNERRQEICDLDQHDLELALDLRGLVDIKTNCLMGMLMSSP